MMMKTKISNDELAGIRSLDELRRMRQRIELQTMLTEYRVNEGIASFFSVGRIVGRIVQQTESIRAALSGAMDIYATFLSLFDRWREMRCERKGEAEKQDEPAVSDSAADGVAGL